MLYFLPFSNAELLQLATVEMDKWAARAMKRHNIKLEWTDEALKAIVLDYDIHYGARSIQHAVDAKIINKIAAEQESVCFS
jgi:ATP-dependent Clp protease ATP-binding subunit ClpB